LNKDRIADKKICFKSYQRNLDDISDNLVILGDNCDRTTQDWIESCVKIYGDPSKTTYQWNEGLGNSRSFVNAAALALTSKSDFVLFAEDDYLWSEDSSQAAQEGCLKFKLFTLYDHPDKYSDLYYGEQASIAITENFHWRSTPSTTMTFFCDIETLRKNCSIMQEYCYDSIPKDHQMWLALTKQRYPRLFSVLSPVATHSEKTWLSPHRNWNKVVHDNT